MFQAFLIKYAEIGIKGKNRFIFENALKDQIAFALKDVEGEFHVVKDQGRIYVEASGEFDYDDAIEAMTRVFGISQICPVVLVEDTSWESVQTAVKAYVENVYGKEEMTFKMEAKRANKNYPLTSPQICMDMGEYLLNEFPNLKVDVHNPQVRIHVEIRNVAYIYSKSIPGPGGMPVGTNGKAMLLLSGGIDSPVAGYMIAKRGVKLSATYFHAPPYTSERAKQKVVDLARIVSRYSGPIELNIINFTDIQLYIYEKCPHEELTIIMRRYMMKIAEELAHADGSLGLITGESIGQVASQTMQSLAVTNEVCTLPVYRPLIGFDKQEIVDYSEKIGTYETSVLPFEDCCTIFVAKHPVTKPNLNIIKRSERNLEEKIDELVRTALDSVEKVLVK